MAITSGKTGLTEKVDIPTKTNPIDNEIVLSPKVEEHTILSNEVVATKRPWADDLDLDMYADTIIDIDGSRVPVEYFSAISKDDTVISANSELISSAHRENIRINNYPIFLTGEMGSNTDAKSQKTDTESNAIVTGVLPPQVSDYFVMSTGLNRDSVFWIKSSKPLSIYRTAAYEIVYEMKEVEKGRLYDDLVGKTTRNLNYISEKHSLGVKYLLTDDEVRLEHSRRVTADTLINDYTMEFYNRELKVYALKSTHGYHTDSIITNFLMKISIVPSDLFHYPEYHETASMNTIFDALLYGQKAMMANLMSKVYYYILNSPSDIGNVQPSLLSPITSMPFQKGNNRITLPEPNVAHNVIHDWGRSDLSEMKISDLFPDISEKKHKHFPSVLLNDTYIFSSSFYEGTPTNTLEELLLLVLNGQSISMDMVTLLISESYSLRKEERFFITPFLITLSRLKEYTNG